MRLIDADALEKEFCSGCQYENNKYSNCIDCALAHAPTIEERKAGRWTSENACEFCGFQPWYENDIHTLSFCPNCGADMRGGNNETP